MKRFFIFCLFAIPAFGQTTNISIQNPSFEAPVTLTGTTGCGNAEWTSIPNWIVNRPPGGSFGIIDWTCVNVPDGKAVAFLGNSSISQGLGIQPQTGVYVLKFWAGNWFYKYPAHYDASLTMGGKVLCHTESYVLGDFNEVTLTCLVPGLIANDHQFGFAPGNLGILVQASEWTLLIDNFSLTFTPQD